MQWFRMYAEAVDDEKLRLLAFEDRWHFVALLCLKAQGTLDEKNPELRVRKICIKLGLDSMELETVMKRLETVGLVSHDYEPVSWRKRQFLSDSSTSRVQAFRQRQRNVSETPSESDTEQKQNRREKKKIKTPVANATPPEGVEGLDSVAWSQWIAYRTSIRKPVKPASIPAAQRKLAAHGTSQAAVVEHSIANGYTGLYASKDQPPQQNGGQKLEKIYPGYRF